ncbi:NAD(P)H-dependent oxidoreductase [Fructilactobacillus myrtifloralis]|uniref:NAD(P)H-dependent oxidoreductase n=1 Tax=Fructilactobacillus myrtifloralis TaxID=2940301 RepID=A0ABY5BQW6_9LACO|nr:NAD(P)H-dependent oxidoreductase [Fructilactobacillus myrtifloralis]USS84789.1 NAD(P)H-dependent oxidoreductase [Fructilactobacillus myrtifloralis]
MKTLVIVAHPEYEDSSTQAFLKRAQAEFETVTWKRLDSSQWPLDVSTEQQALIAAERVIFQFPLYWYSAPALLKQWEDDVLTRAFTFASERGCLADKQLGIVTSLGSAAQEFQAGGTEGFSLSEILTPYRALAHRAGMQFLKPLVIDQFGYQSEAEQAELLIKYQQYLTAPQPLSFEQRVDWLIQQLKRWQTTQPVERQQRLALVIDQLSANQEHLDDLKDQIKLIRQAEEG